MHVSVHANKLPIAPRKFRAVLGQLRHRTVPQAVALMLASARPTAEPIRKLLLASISAARDKHPSLQPEQLLIEEIYANESVRQYRTRRKSRGRSARYAKRGSHLTLTVQWTEDRGPKTKQARPSSVVRPPSSAAKQATPTKRKQPPKQTLKSR